VCLALLLAPIHTTMAVNFLERVPVPLGLLGEHMVIDQHPLPDDHYRAQGLAALLVELVHRMRSKIFEISTPMRTFYALLGIY
jgi:hypothetical protein